jgi:uncharacterized protein YutE (UPF0331/DUF86 family)
MDILTFIIELLKAVAWPITALGIAMLFRGQLISLLNRIRKGKLGPAEFEFEEAVKALKEEAAEVVQAPLAIGVGTPTVKLVSSEPRAAILSAWLQVEAAAANLAIGRQLVDPRSARNPSAVIRAIQKAEIIQPQYISLLSELRHLRNQAVHETDFSPSTESVLSYVQLAEEIANAMQSAR